jgi:hypothetical protein
LPAALLWDLDFLSSDFLSCDKLTVCAVSTYANLWIIPKDKWAEGTDATIKFRLPTGPCKINALSLIQESHIFCQHLRSFLACKRGKSTLHSSWQWEKRFSFKSNGCGRHCDEPIKCNLLVWCFYSFDYKCLIFFLGRGGEEKIHWIVMKGGESRAWRIVPYLCPLCVNLAMLRFGTFVYDGTADWVRKSGRVVLTLLHHTESLWGPVCF